MPRRLMTCDAALESISCAGVGVAAAGVWWFVLEYLTDRQEHARA